MRQTEAIRALAEQDLRGRYVFAQRDLAKLFPAERGGTLQASLGRLVGAGVRTPFGVIEFTHTKRRLEALLDSMVDVGRPLRLATRAAAWRDLKRVGRNTHLVEWGPDHAA